MPDTRQDADLPMRIPAHWPDAALIYGSEGHPAAPILTIQDGAADITITSPGRGEVTEEDVAFGRLLAEAVARYAAELDKLAARNRVPADGPGTAGRVA